MTNKLENRLMGIQGAKGSFNHQAIKTVMLAALQETVYALAEQITDENIAFLCNTHNVLIAVLNADVLYGQFAIYNSTGGLVEETATAINSLNEAKDCLVLATAEMDIEQCLILRDGVSLEEIDTIMSHPQSIKQCQQYIKNLNLRRLEKGKAKFNVSSGEGEQIDHAVVAEQLSSGELSSSTAVIGPVILAKQYPNLKIEAQAINDNQDNRTLFVLVALTETLQKEFPEIYTQELQRLGQLFASL
ncbi:MAG: prephenate dehydratase domain-containing protein [Candidatus Woesebacteria bacterium]|jgi:prephenate dehydratase